jgi:hypothetical protein
MAEEPLMVCMILKISLTVSDEKLPDSSLASINFSSCSMFCVVSYINMSSIGSVENPLSNLLPPFLFCHRSLYHA